MIENANLERRLRRALSKAGYSLHKRGSGYMIVDVRINGIVAGSNAGIGYEPACLVHLDMKRYLLMPDVVI